MRPTVSDHEQDLYPFFGRTPERYAMDHQMEGKGVFVLFTNRCGSNYFVDLLNQQKTIKLHHEMFNADMVMRVCQEKGLTSFSDYVRHLRTLKFAPAWGSKIGAVQLDMLYRFGLLQAFQEGTYIIWLKRKDVVAQAVSHFVAEATQQWTSYQQAAAPEPEYDYEGIARLVTSIIQHNAAAEMSLAVTGLDFIGLWYEDFIAKPNHHLGRVAHFLGEPFEHLKIGATRHKRQDNPLKAEFKERFLADARQRLAIGDKPYDSESPIWQFLGNKGRRK